MNTVFLSTSYLPPVSWIAVCFNYKNIVIEAHETYPKQTIRNRCNIATSSGILGLSVPVIRVNGNHTKTEDIIIDNSTEWQQTHWRSIVSAYNKTPFFLYYRDLFEPIYIRKHLSLVKMNMELLNTIFAAMQISNLNIDFSFQYDFLPLGTDLRNMFYSKQFPYQSVISELPRYMQAFEENHNFLPDISIIDLLFNLGPDAMKYISNLKLTHSV
jgi:hypothetical protein